MTIFKLTKQAYRKLEYAYAKGDIAYPRVFNDYIKIEDLKFYEYPHPKLLPFDRYSIPLEKEKYIVDKTTLPLYLAQSGISTPATLIKNLEIIDKFFDDNMDMRREEDIQLEEDMVQVHDLMKIEAQDFIKKDTLNSKRSTFDKDSSLLDILDKEGDVWRGFEIKIMPYRIKLSPSKKEVNKKEVKEGDENKKYIMPFKRVSNPQKNLERKIIESKHIVVFSIEELLKIENFRNAYAGKKKEIDLIQQKSIIKRRNSIGRGA